MEGKLLTKILLERDTALRCTYVYAGCSEECGLYGCPTPSAEHREIGVVRNSELRDVAIALIRLARRQRIWRIEREKRAR